MKPTLLVLAAGIGSRYGGLKQVDGVGPNGQAIMEYAIYDAIRAGFGKVVFIIRHAIEDAFKEKFSGKFDHLIHTEYVFQELDAPVAGITHWPAREKPWGTGHAILMAKEVIQEPFAVINADDYYGPEAFRQMADFLSRHCQRHHLAMVGYLLKNTLSENGSVSRGICSVSPQLTLLSVTERHKILRHQQGISCTDADGRDQPLHENDIVSMNLWGLHPDIFHDIETQFVRFFHDNHHNPKAEFYIPTVVNTLIQQGQTQVTVLHSPDQWYGVTYQEDKFIAQEAFHRFTAAGLYPHQLWTP
jgi:UTP-glucose-1-phosphate uridylyltransferase